MGGLAGVVGDTGMLGPRFKLLNPTPFVLIDRKHQLRKGCKLISRFMSASVVFLRLHRAAFKHVVALNHDHQVPIGEHSAYGFTMEGSFKRDKMLNVRWVDQNACFDLVSLKISKTSSN